MTARLGFYEAPRGRTSDPPITNSRKILDRDIETDAVKGEMRKEADKKAHRRKTTKNERNSFGGDQPNPRSPRSVRYRRKAVKKGKEGFPRTNYSRSWKGTHLEKQQRKGIMEGGRVRKSEEGAGGTMC